MADKLTQASELSNDNVVSMSPPYNPRIYDTRVCDQSYQIHWA